MKRVSPREAKALVDAGYTYVDVRSQEEFRAGHPEGAVNVPLLDVGPAGMAPNPEFLPVMEGAFAKDAKLVVGCRSGGRSLRAAEMLVAAGFSEIVDQRAVYEGAPGQFGARAEPGWAPSGLPVATGAPAGRTWADVKAKAGR